MVIENWGRGGARGWLDAEVNQIAQGDEMEMEMGGGLAGRRAGVNEDGGRGRGDGGRLAGTRCE